MSKRQLEKLCYSEELSEWQSRWLFYKYASNHTSSREQNENWQALGQLTEALIDREPSYYSYGLFAPNYRDGLLMHKSQALHTDTPHRALLIGAYTPDTIREFVTTVKSVYPDAKCAVIDPAGVSTPLAAQDIFVYGSGLQMPFASRSFDTVHTSSLIGFLPSKFKRMRADEALFTEAQRVMKYDGRLIMVDNPKFLKLSNLRYAGLTAIVDKKALQYKRRRDMERVLTFGAVADPSMYTVNRNERFYVCKRVGMS